MLPDGSTIAVKMSIHQFAFGFASDGRLIEGVFPESI
jgi:hypothetical protein